MILRSKGIVIDNSSKELDTNWSMQVRGRSKSGLPFPKTLERIEYREWFIQARGTLSR
jgi:hypothetical protein